MYTLKQSTTITVPFFGHDANGDGVLAIADGSWTKRISKNGGAFASMTVTITEMENGWYSVPLSTAHTDTVGFLTVSLSATGVKRVNLQFQVSVRLLDDLAFPATSGRSLLVDTAGAITLTDGSVTAPKFATDALTDTKVASSLCNKIADHVIRRSFSNVKAAAGPDIKTFRSLLGVVAKQANKVSVAGTTLTVYEDDDTTALGTQAITTDSAALPITSLDTT